MEEDVLYMVKGMGERKRERERLGNMNTCILGKKLRRKKNERKKRWFECLIRCLTSSLLRVSSNILILYSSACSKACSSSSFKALIFFFRTSRRVPCCTWVMIVVGVLFLVAKKMRKCLRFKGRMKQMKTDRYSRGSSWWWWPGNDFCLWSQRPSGINVIHSGLHFVMQGKLRLCLSFKLLWESTAWVECYSCYQLGFCCLADVVYVRGMSE